MELRLHSSMHPFGYPENILKSCILSYSDQNKSMLLVVLKPLRLDDPETSRMALGLTQHPIQWVPWGSPCPERLKSQWGYSCAAPMCLHLVQRVKFILT
jgi:hypothetical protein